MARKIEDYAVIGNCGTMALVGIDGSIDWLGLPRFDSPACFAALLGDERHGRWLIAPIDGAARSTRHYRGNTLILETIFELDTGSVRVVDFMSRRGSASDLIRIVCGVSGAVAMRVELVVRFDYGSVTPWVTRQSDGRLNLTAGPDRLLLATPVALRGEDFRTVGEFEVQAGEEIDFVLSWSRSYHAQPDSLAAQAALREVEDSWSNWAQAFKPAGEWSDAVLRSLLTLKVARVVAARRRRQPGRVTDHVWGRRRTAAA